MSNRKRKCDCFCLFGQNFNFMVAVAPTKSQYLWIPIQAAQNYTLKVTALDSNDEPIDYFEDPEQ